LSVAIVDHRFFGGKVAKQTVEKWCSGGKKGLKYFTDFEQMNLEMEP